MDLRVHVLATVAITDDDLSFSSSNCVPCMICIQDGRKEKRGLRNKKGDGKVGDVRRKV
jgi:hypothetical protein